MTNLEELREIIIRANYPKSYEVDGEFRTMDNFAHETVVYSKDKPITLSMVLITLQKLHDWDCYWNHSEPGIINFPNGMKWNLTKDLNNQEPETIINLLKLLKGE